MTLMSSRAVPQITSGGRILRYARHHAGLTQRGLEDKSGVPQETIARIEASRTSPRFDTIVHLLAVCGFELEVEPKKGIGVNGSQPRASAKAPKARRPEPQPFLRKLAEGGVRFVVIGGVAANFAGSTTTTTDLDICYARDPENFKALAAVLRGLGAVLRNPPDDGDDRLDARTFPKGDSFSFTAPTGNLNVLGTPSGTKGYSDLVRAATQREVDGSRVLVASIDDLMRIKRAAGRAKDHAHIEQLAELRHRQDHLPA
jgi:transcriptional regulator with XRE-family HTH domain